MAKLELEIVGYNKALETMTINGKSVKLKKKDGGSRVCTYETDQKEAKIRIYKGHYYTGKNWFWWNLLYYIVSIFGLFDVRLDKKCQVIDSRLNVKLLEPVTKIKIKLCNFAEGGKFVEVEDDMFVEEEVNVQYMDKEAQKRHKKMRKTKIWLTIAILVAAVVTCVVLL